jgi:ribonucleoside-diphosphate reductase alpha chain
MQAGGGVGYDFSTLRPRGLRARATGAIASGPVSFLRIWDSACATMLSTGARRGAMMGTLRIDHPDVLEFAEAKRTAGELTHFNLSLLVPDGFMNALEHDWSWPLVFPADRLEGSDHPRTIEREWPGEEGPVECAVLGEMPARELWRAIMRAAYDTAEPGVIFSDRVNDTNNLWYRERIRATNPCGELPLPPYGACDLGSINLPAFVRDPFQPGARLDLEGVSDIARVATRFLDDVIDASRYPLPAQRAAAIGARRIGLGITGLGDALLMLGLEYGESEGRAQAGRVMRVIGLAAYESSIDLALEKGCFPELDRARFLEGRFARGLPVQLRSRIETDGLRNSHLLAIAPAGSISLLANNVSSGIEPVFAARQRRRITEADGSVREIAIEDFAHRLRRERSALAGAEPLATHPVSPEAQIEMMAELQRWVDSAISKTVAVPAEASFESVAALYSLAHARGLKGCTVFRPVELRGQVLVPADAQCCTLDRESD